MVTKLQKNNDKENTTKQELRNYQNNGHTITKITVTQLPKTTAKKLPKQQLRTYQTTVTKLPETVVTSSSEQ